MIRSLLTLILVLLLAGCGAARGMYFLWDAQKDVAQAEAVGAPEAAVYEYTLARQYLLKAKEEAGYSDYRAAEDLALEATKWAGRAEEIAEYGTSERELMLDEIDDFVPEDAGSLD